MSAALAVLPAFVAAWRIGRPQAVTIADVDNSGAVSDVFRPRVLEVLAESGWRAERFLAAAADGAVPRFRASKLDALREHLAEAGCLDERTPLSPDELVTEVLLRTALPRMQKRAPLPKRCALSCIACCGPCRRNSPEIGASRPSGSDPTS